MSFLDRIFGRGPARSVVFPGPPARVVSLSEARGPQGPLLGQTSPLDLWAQFSHLALTEGWSLDSSDIDKLVAIARSAGDPRTLTPMTEARFQPFDTCPSCAGRLWPVERWTEVECADCRRRYPSGCEAVSAEHRWLIVAANKQEYDTAVELFGSRDPWGMRGVCERCFRDVMVAEPGRAFRLDVDAFAMSCECGEVGPLKWLL